MSVQLRRKNASDTMAEAFVWLKRNPALLLVFLVVGLLDGGSEVVVGLGILGTVLSVVAGAVAHRIALAEAEGRSTAVADEIGPVLGRLLSLLGAYLIYVFLVGIGLVLLIVPGIYLALRLSLAFPAIVIDDEDAFESLSTSWDVAEGNLLKLLGISLLAFLVVFSTLIVGAFFGALLDLAVGVESASITVTALLALGSVVLTATIGPIVELSYGRVYLENRGTGPSEASWETTDDDWGATSDEDWGTAADDDWGAGNDDSTDDWGTTDDEDEAHW